MIWKPVKYKGRHFIVSDAGRVRDFKGKPMQKYWIGDYKAVYGRIPVKDLIAKAFCKNYKKGKVVNHLNGIKHDDRARNLEWATQQENVIHAYKTGLVKNITRRLTLDEIEDIKINPDHAMDKYNISHTRLYKILGKKVICR